MRILQVTPGYSPEVGGVQAHVQAISERLAGRGHQVQVATMAHWGTAPAFEVVNGITVRRFFGVGPNDAYRLPLGFVRYLIGAQRDFDVVHVHNYHAAMIPLVAAIKPATLVITPHLNDQPHSGLARWLHVPYLLMGRWSMRRAQAVICVSPSERDRVVARLRVAPSKTAVIPNGVEETAWSATRPQPARDPHLLLSVGRLEPYKRVEDAIACLTALPEPYHLVVIGKGPHRAALEAFAQAQGVADRVQLMGYVSNEALPDWYLRAGVVLNLSTAEAFGMTVLESVAGGCRVVCRDIPAFRDLAVQFPAYVTTVPEVLPEVIGAAVSAFSARAADPPADLSHFTWSTIAAETESLYRWCLRGEVGARVPDLIPAREQANAKQR